MLLLLLSLLSTTSVERSTVLSGSQLSVSYSLQREVRQESVLVSGSVTGWETLVSQVFEGEVVEGRLRLRDEGVNPAGARIVLVRLGG